MVIEGFVGQEVSRISRQRFEQEAGNFRRHLEFNAGTRRSSFRRIAGDAMVRAGCRVAGIDPRACLSGDSVPQFGRITTARERVGGEHATV